MKPKKLDRLTDLEYSLGTAGKLSKGEQLHFHGKQLFDKISYYSNREHSLST